MCKITPDLPICQSFWGSKQVMYMKRFWKVVRITVLVIQLSPTLISLTESCLLNWKQHCLFLPWIWDFSGYLIGSNFGLEVHWSLCSGSWKHAQRVVKCCLLPAFLPGAWILGTNPTFVAGKMGPGTGLWCSMCVYSHMPQPLKGS